MAAIISFTIGLTEISGAVAAGSLPELLLAGSALVGSLIIVKEIVKEYKTGESGEIPVEPA